ncbi:uncharacterized protein LOC126974560 [Leptidea sinapis]|uniref:uncharacterized protein LOC126974560 n=1 Tax=Leptidea sinapis TaxID=189913 RepID=UPI00212782E7|nr:uncharacterized protein LOC126974560 [Leptidea sinapis]
MRFPVTFYVMSVVFLTANTKVVKDEVDKVIEHEITRKLSTDLLQSIEKKFHVDLERSVDMVMMKIKLLLQNGTHHIQEKLLELQSMMDIIKSHGEEEANKCLVEQQNITSALAEKTLHQMVVCGYALIGQDPSQAIRNVGAIKTMIRQGVKPLYEHEIEVYELLNVCGHEHDSLRKVIKCVIAKSPLIKSTMMDITGKLINGVMELTKLMAHGAMHEACLIEVIKSIENDAVGIINDIRKCAYANLTFTEVDDYLAANNATVLETEHRPKNKTNANEYQEIIRNVLEEVDTKAVNGLTNKFKTTNNNTNGNFLFNDEVNKD